MSISEINIINQIRSEVLSRKEPTGENLFLVWGYPTAFFLLLEFIALRLWNQNWCEWLWTGIPLIGTPLMIYYLHKDYERTGSRTLESNIILQMWIFIGFLSFTGGLAMGFANVFEYGYCTLQSLLISMGCFLTGIILRFRPKVFCGIAGALLSFLCLFPQGELWPWQLLITSFVTIITLIIPGHYFKNYIRNYHLWQDSNFR